MRILAIDDKAMPRKVLVRAIVGAAPDAEVVSCANAAEVLALPDVASFDVAFVDIDMPGMSGMELAEELKRLNPRMNIVFATGYGEYMHDAFSLHSSGYLMKPITVADVAKELADLRFPLAPQEPNRLRVRCFGEFEVFVGDKPLIFGRSKAKELFAYLIDRRGAMVSLREVEATLWEDQSDGKQISSSYLRTLTADLRRTLSSCGHEDLLTKRYGALGVVAEMIDCDYYDYLRGDPQTIANWNGLYMEQYPWAEMTKVALF